MSLLLDTNVLSELRKGERANALLLDWFNGVAGPHPPRRQGSAKG